MSAQKVTNKTKGTKSVEKNEYRSVSEMVHGLSEVVSFADEVEDDLSKRTIVHYLFAARLARGVSQQEMAKRLRCSQSRVSKLESGVDDDLRFGDLKKYLCALGVDVSVIISRSDSRLVDLIKFHAFSIRRMLAKLCDLAKKDPEVGKGVQQFHVEALFNLVKLVADSAKNLPDFPLSFPPLLETDDSDDTGNGDSTDCDVSMGEKHEIESESVPT